MCTVHYCSCFRSRVLNPFCLQCDGGLPKMFSYTLCQHKG